MFSHTVWLAHTITCLPMGKETVRMAISSCLSGPNTFLSAPLPVLAPSLPLSFHILLSLPHLLTLKYPSLDIITLILIQGWFLSIMFSCTLLSQSCSMSTVSSAPTCSQHWFILGPFEWLADVVTFVCRKLWVPAELWHTSIIFYELATPNVMLPQLHLSAKQSPRMSFIYFPDNISS